MKTILFKIKDYIINNKNYCYNFLIGLIATLIIGVFGAIAGLIGGCIISLGKEAYKFNKSKEDNVNYTSLLGSSVIGVIVGTFILIIM